MILSKNRIAYETYDFSLCFTFISIFVDLGFFLHFETVTNIKTWIKSQRYWRML